MATGAPKHSLERRKKPRIPRRLPVRFGSEARMSGGNAVDISEGGMRVEASETFPQNSILQVFVQFPRHSVRLRARVAWLGGQQEGSPVMGLHFIQPEPVLVRAYQEWQAEVKLALAEDQSRSPAPLPLSPLPQSPPPPAEHTPVNTGAARPADPRQEPKGAVRRRLETKQGNSYDILMEKRGGAWQVTIAQLPRQIGVDEPELEDSFSTFALADQAVRDFIRSH
jgi:PilZ domain-containing protein